MWKLVAPFLTGTTEITCTFYWFLFRNGIRINESLGDDNMFSLLTMSLSDIDNDYLGMFFLTWAMAWERNLHLGEGWLCTECLILSFDTLLCSPGEAAPQKAWWDCLQLGLTFFHLFIEKLDICLGLVIDDSWHTILLCYTFLMDNVGGGVCPFSLAIPQSPSLFLSLTLVLKILFASWSYLPQDYFSWKGPIHDLLLTTVWLMNLIRSRRYCKV